MARTRHHQHKGMSRQQPKLPYCPTLGEHHLNWEGRHYTSNAERRLRNMGAFILPLWQAPAPNHTLIHRSLGETPRPNPDEIYDMISAAEEGGLYQVMNTLDNRTTEHYRKQLFIAAMPTDEAIGRLYKKQYVTQQELRGF